MSRQVFWRPLMLQISAWSSLLLGSWLLCLMLMQLLFGRELTRDRKSTRLNSSHQ